MKPFSEYNKYPLESIRIVAQEAHQLGPKEMDSIETYLSYHLNDKEGEARGIIPQ